MYKYMVSILIAAYNVSQYIERCLKSLEVQTFKDFEVIIVNDCSTDTTKDVIANYLNKSNLRAVVIDLDENQGPSFGRHTALAKARGDYFYCIDGDDWIEPDAIEKFYNKAIEQNYDMVACDFYIDTGQSKNPVEFKESEPAKIQYNNVAGHWSVVWRHFVKTSFAKGHDLIKENRLNGGEDYLLINQLSLFTTSIGYVRKPLYHYFVNNTTSIMKSVNMQALADQFKATQYIEDIVKTKKRPDLTEALNFRYLYLKKEIFKMSLKAWRKWKPDANSFRFSKNNSLKDKIVFLVLSFFSKFL